MTVPKMVILKHGFSTDMFKGTWFRIIKNKTRIFTEDDQRKSGLVRCEAIRVTRPHPALFPGVFYSYNFDFT
jgi:hypothetical protein